MKEHEFRESVAVDIWYPDHPPRTESALFSRTKHNLINQLDLPCFICGTKELREVHHFHVEWAFADGVDWEKMKTLHPNFPWDTFKDPSDFVDHPYNMMILCQEHHRKTDRGIHNMPYPLWIMQQHSMAGFDLFGEPTAAIKPSA